MFSFEETKLVLLSEIWYPKMEKQGESLTKRDEVDEDMMKGKKKCGLSESLNDAEDSTSSGHHDFVIPANSPSPPPSAMINDEANVVDAQPLPLKKKAKPRKSTNRIKTQFANRWLQFLHEKRSANASSGSKLDLNKSRSEYWALTEEQRAVYDEMALKEKFELGDNFRNKTLIENAVEQVKEKKQKKKRPKQCAKKCPSLGEQVPEIQKSLPSLLNNLKEIDTSLDCLQIEIDELKEVKLARMVEVATSKASLKLKSENVVVLKEKVSNMYKIHRNCIIP